MYINRVVIYKDTYCIAKMKVILLIGAIIAMLMVSLINAEEDRCPCPRNLEPVCASNGRTYNNMCEYKCVEEKYNLKITKRSACQAEVYA